MPPVALVQPPIGAPASRNALLEAWLTGNGGPLREPVRYLPYRDVQADILRSARTVPPADEAAAHGHPAGALRSLPLSSARGMAVILVDARTGTPVQGAD